MVVGEAKLRWSFLQVASPENDSFFKYKLIQNQA